MDADFWLLARRNPRRDMDRINPVHPGLFGETDGF